MKLVAVVHVGSLSGVACSANQTPRQPIELHGDAVDVCRVIMAQPSRMIEAYIRVTQDAVDDVGHGGWERLMLVPDSSCIVVSNDDASFDADFGLTTFSLRDCRE